MPVRHVFLVLGLMLAAAGCAKVKAAVCADMVPAPKPGAPAAKDAKGPTGGGEAPQPEVAAAERTLTSEAHPEGPAQEQFALPFAWEKSPDEPLSKTRAYLREIARDNAAYMRRGPEFFKPFANAEAPRATVVSCADSRVQPGAFDGSAENDAFTVRNLGNQLEPGMGAIQYGVEQLNTPVLMILGHTDCTAIKAALSGTSKLSEPIRKELSSLKLTKKRPKKVDDAFVAQVVIENVNDQVERALTAFTKRVNAGQLTIIGAVYDFRNDLGKGQGKVTIVNVNGITEAGRLKAFHDAVLAGANIDAAGKSLDPFERLSQVFAEHMHDDDGIDIEDMSDDDEPANEKIVVKPGAATKPGAAAKPPAPAPPKPAAHNAPAPAHEPPAPGTIPATAAKPSHH